MAFIRSENSTEFMANVCKQGKPTVDHKPDPLIRCTETDVDTATTEIKSELTKMI